MLELMPHQEDALRADCVAAPHAFPQRHASPIRPPSPVFGGGGAVIRDGGEGPSRIVAKLQIMI